MQKLHYCCFWMCSHYITAAAAHICWMYCLLLVHLMLTEFLQAATANNMKTCRQRARNMVCSDVMLKASAQHCIAATRSQVNELQHPWTADVTEAVSHLKEAAVGIQDGRQVPADIGVNRSFNVNVLKAHFNAWRMDSHPANNSTLLNDYV